VVDDLQNIVTAANPRLFRIFPATAQRDLGGPGAAGLMDDVQIGGRDRIRIEQACRLVGRLGPTRALDAPSITIWATWMPLR